MSGKYIVVFKPGVSKERIDGLVKDVNSNGGEVTSRYDGIMLGFAATITTQFLMTLQSLQGDEIDYIEPDGVVTTQGTTQ